ncbi:MAG: hypothetical protein Q4A04_01080 [Eubacteriales bacterium]|nr:hypothetical protein [Eubacteriales bacterium]
MPSIDDVAKVLSEMDSETYNAAVHFIFYLKNEREKKESENIRSQLEFLRETSGKISIDENAVNDLRMRSMI